jgi:hypothetical protein
MAAKQPPRTQIPPEVEKRVLTQSRRRCALCFSLNGKVIEGGEHEIHPFDMEEGDELVFSIDASDPLDVVICDEEDAEGWADGDVDDEDDEERPLPAGYLHRTGITEWRERSFTASEAGRYVLLLVNWDDESTEVIVDAAVWEAEE